MELMSARQVAAQLGVSKAYACRLFTDGKIPAQKVDTDWIVKAKDVRAYLDEKSGVPMYYRDTRDWEREDYYFLFRVLDKMVHDRRGRYDEELSSINETHLSAAARAMLAAMGTAGRFNNLVSIAKAKAVNPPLVLSDYPTIGGFPDFERYGLIL